MAIRLAMLLGAATLGLAGHPGALAETRSDSWEFEVLLDERSIGFHRFELDCSGSRQRLETEASFDVRILFFNAFRYRHRNTEVWEDGCLAGIDAVTDSNGDELFVRGRQDGAAFAVSATGNDTQLDGCIRSFAYWNPAILGADRLLNSQTGTYEPVSTSLEGEDTLDVGGDRIRALRYALETRNGTITLWYASDDGRWLALEAPATGKRKLRYLPRQIPARLPPGIQNDLPQAVLVAGNSQAPLPARPGSRPGSSPGAEGRETQ